MARRFTLQIKVSEPEFLAANMIATRERVNVSEAMRLLIRREVDREGLLISRLEAGGKSPMLQGLGNG